MASGAENAKDDGEVATSEDRLGIPKIGKPCRPHKTWQCAPVIPIFCFIVCRDNLQR